MTHSAEKLHPIVSALTAARHRAGLSQRALADRIGLTQSHISKIERGAVDPQISSLIELARVLELEFSLVPMQLLPALRALVREISPNPRESNSLERELTQLARRARALIKPLPQIKELPGIALAADELRNVRLDETSYAEASSSVAAARVILGRLRDLSRAQSAEAVRDASEPLEAVRQALRRIRNSSMHRDTASRQSPAYRLDDADA